MTDKEMIRLREALSWPASKLASELEIDRKTLRKYEDGTGKIPRSIALACAALNAGLAPYGAAVA